MATLVTKRSSSEGSGCDKWIARFILAASSDQLLIPTIATCCSPSGSRSPCKTYKIMRFVMKQLELIIHLNVWKYLSQENIHNVLDYIFQVIEGKKKFEDFFKEKSWVPPSNLKVKLYEKSVYLGLFINCAYNMYLKRVIARNFCKPNFIKHNNHHNIAILTIVDTSMCFFKNLWKNTKWLLIFAWKLEMVQKAKEKKKVCF